MEKLILAQGQVYCHKVPVLVLLVPKNRLYARNLAIYKPSLYLNNKQE